MWVLESKEQIKLSKNSKGHIKVKIAPDEAIFLWHKIDIVTPFKKSYCQDSDFVHLTKIVGATTII